MTSGGVSGNTQERWEVVQLRLSRPCRDSSSLSKIPKAQGSRGLGVVKDQRIIPGQMPSTLGSRRSPCGWKKWEGGRTSMPGSEVSEFLGTKLAASGGLGQSDVFQKMET